FHSTLSAPPRPTLFPYTTLFRSPDEPIAIRIEARYGQGAGEKTLWLPKRPEPNRVVDDGISISHPTRVQDVLEIEGVLLDFPERSEEHTSELQSRENLVCRLLLE